MGPPCTSHSPPGARRLVSPAPARKQGGRKGHCPCLASGGRKDLLEHTCFQISPNCPLVQSIALQTSLPFSRPDTPAASTPLLQSIALLAPVQSALPSSLPYMPSCLHPFPLHRTLLLSHPLTHLLPQPPCSPSPCWPAWSPARCPSCRQRPRQAAATAAASAWWCRTVCRWEKCGKVLHIGGDVGTFLRTHLPVTESIATPSTCALRLWCQPANLAFVPERHMLIGRR